MKLKIIQIILFITLVLIAPIWAWNLNVIEGVSEARSLVNFMLIPIFGLILPITTFIFYCCELKDICKNVQRDARQHRSKEDRNFPTLRHILVRAVPLTITFENFWSDIEGNVFVNHIKDLIKEQKSEKNIDKQ